MERDFSLSIQTHRARAAVVKVFLFRFLNYSFASLTKKVLAFIAFIFFVTPSYTQSITDHEIGYWFRYFNQTKLNQRWSWHTEIDERRLINPDRQSQFFMHTHVHYTPNKKFDMAAGFNFNQTKRTNGLLISEWRPWQEISFTPELKSRIKLSIRYRLDERFIRRATGSDLEHGYNFNLRHRFRIQAASTLNKKENITLRLSDEVMVNSGGNADLFDQNRIYLGADFKLTKKCSLEVGYLNQIVLRSDHFVMFNVIRTTFWHKLNWKKDQR
ncbi:MAG: DUF2490 domain-containing protein [Cyclobacteriaceae bacterium]|nr:DUF2490 domain-containing protein [Cyclobacteriaceae bacterium]